MCRRMLWPSLVIFGVWVALPHATATALVQKAEYDLDIVATTNLATSKEHAAAYLQGLMSEADHAFAGLSVKTYDAGEVPKDGTARHRLVLDHKGTVTLGSTLTSRVGFPKSDIKSFVNGKRLDIVIGTDFKHHQTLWFLPAKHTGTIAFKFQQWDGAAYKTLESWSITAPDRSEVAEAKGILLVADLVQDGNKVKIDLKPKCPKTLEQAKKDALMMLMPGEFNRTISSRLAKGTVSKAKGDASGMVEVEVVVENKSPWPLTAAQADAFVQGAVLAGRLEFQPPIPAGKSAKAKMTVSPEQPDTKRVPGVRLTELGFDRPKQ